MYAYMIHPGAGRKIIICAPGWLYAPDIASVQVCVRPVSFAHKDSALLVDLPERFGSSHAGM